MQYSSHRHNIWVQTELWKGKPKASLKLIVKISSGLIKGASETKDVQFISPAWANVWGKSSGTLASPVNQASFGLQENFFLSLCKRPAVRKQGNSTLLPMLARLLFYMHSYFLGWSLAPVAWPPSINSRRKGTGVERLAGTLAGCGTFMPTAFAAFQPVHEQRQQGQKPWYATSVCCTLYHQALWF